MSGIKDKLDLILENTPEEQIEFDAQIIAFQFLSIIDEEMEKQNISKKELGKRIGKSSSFITQIFKGDRKPNWHILARMQQVLGLEFKILEQQQFEQWVEDKLEDRLSWSKLYETSMGKKGKPNKTEVPKEDYALAG